MSDALRDAVLDRKGRKESGGEIRFLCPVHEEREPSCYYNVNSGLFYCQGCGAAGNARKLAEILNVPIPDDDHGLNLPPGIYPKWQRGKFHFRTLYDYRAADGSILGYVVRYESATDKNHIPFFVRDGDRWKPGSQKPPRTLYRLETLQKRPDDRVWIVEGEKCVDAITQLGELAVTSLAGSKSAKKADWSPLAGREVLIWPDNDEPGEVYAAQVRALLSQLEPAPQISTVIVASLGLTQRGADVVDWLDADSDRGRDHLDAIPLKSAPPPGAPASGSPAVEGAGVPSLEWVDQLLVTDKGKLKPTLSNLILIIRNHSEWRDVLGYNTRSLREIVRKAPPWHRGQHNPDQLIDQHSRLTTEWIAQRFEIGVSSALCHEALATVAQENPFDPVREYFDSLEWDQVERLDTWLHDHAGTPRDPYHDAVGAKFLISGVARTYRPGVKVDTMLILQGPQGSFKSTVLRELAGPEFFSDQLHDISNKDGLMQIHGPLLIEMQELDATSKKEATAVKEFLSTQVDTFRPPYGRVVRDYPRTCIFAGSTNQNLYLKDDTGARRFWPVTVQHIDVAGVIDNRDQLWAEAVHRFRHGEQWYLEGDAEVQAELEQEARRQGDPWESLIAIYLQDTKIKEFGEIGMFGDDHKRRYCTTKEILKEAVKLPEGQQNRPHEMRVGAILTRLGWRKTRRRLETEGRQVWVYRPPADYHDERPIDYDGPLQPSFGDDY